MGRVKKNAYENGYHSPFATRLRELLDTPDVSQAKVAEYVGVTRQAISSYSLGTSVPDIEKLIGIASFFEVSTEYLLGRTEIKKADATKQVVAEYLNLSEEAIDAIHRLQNGYLEQNIVDDYKLSSKMEPLGKMFSAWVEAADLSKLFSDLYRAILASARYKGGVKNTERYILGEEDKQSVSELQAKGYVVLGLTEQLDFYTQSAVKTFQASVERLLIEADNIVGERDYEED
jgi:transcriptional regulator with XRE-family HTH domain